MFSLAKLMQSTKVFLHPRLAASLSANASTTPRTPTPTIEEKLGLPPRPKRPLTPYFRFLKSIRPQMVAENPTKSATELVQLISKKWETVDDRQKEKFAEEYKKDKEEYVKKHALYDSKLTEVQKQELQLAKEDRVHDKEKRAYKKKIRENDKPKKPASGFLRYLKDQYAKKEGGDMHYRDQLKKIAETWKQLPEAKRSKYNEDFKKDNVVYAQELAKWELKMIRLGNLDLVRNEALIEEKPVKARRARAEKSH